MAIAIKIAAVKLLIVPSTYPNYPPIAYIIGIGEASALITGNKTMPHELKAAFDGTHMGAAGGTLLICSSTYEYPRFQKPGSSERSY
jgi:hypothetical protein